MRWVVAVFLLAGCFTKPGLRDRDGGGNGDGGDDGGDDDGGGGDGGIVDGPAFDSLLGCTWMPLGRRFDEAADERAPWMSGDGLWVTWWSGTGNGTAGNGVIMQADRETITGLFNTPMIIYPSGQTSGAPDDGDPALNNGLLKMYLTTATSGGMIQSQNRAMPHGMFGAPPSTDSELALVNAIGQVREGGFITADSKTFVFVAGDSVNTYSSEDVYITRRATGSGNFPTPVKYPHSIAGKNECCPTMAGNLLMYEREATSGKTEIVSSLFDGVSLGAGTSWSMPEVVVLPGSNSFQQPTLSADGKHLIYVENLGNDWHLEEVELMCP